MRAFIMIVISFFLLNCANPKYAEPTLPSTSVAPRNAKTCAARFESGLCISINWEKPPTEEDFGGFVFQIYRLNSQDGAISFTDPEDNLAVVLWMPSMGHGSSPVSLERLAEGHYRANQLFFSMRGQWEIHFQLKDQSGVRDQAILSFLF